MGKLNPPVIEGTIPAFYGKDIIVPFKMNRSVGDKEFSGLRLKIKTIYNNSYFSSVDSYLYMTDPEHKAYFDISNLKLNPKQSYKIQLAYLDKSVEGYYSTVGVVKYTSKPEIFISGLEKGGVANIHHYTYQGNYVNQDISEKVYQYQFLLYNSKGEIVDSSGWLLHNSSNDTEPTSSYDIYNFPYDLQLNESFYVEYKVKTVNGLIDSSEKYQIQSKETINPEIRARLEAISNYDEGNVELLLIGEKDETGVEYAATGSFRIMRSSSEDNFGVWNEILKFQLFGQQPSRWLWRDSTVKQGVSYKYALQQYNDYSVVSNRIETNPVYIDFENAYLFDGKRQLKIKFNPKVSNFKNTILENKVDTIGNKYPFIFRNGNVKYKEFSISGLISYHMDDNKNFIEWDNEISTDLTGENIAAEREFKLEVLDWLNNGEPKLFRSPTEGNYLVRLLNVSLAPDDSLGRMLHTFTATAYEIAEYTYDNLVVFDILNTKDPTKKILRWHNIPEIKNVDPNTNLLTYQPAVSLVLDNMVPGERLTILFENGNELPIVIGATGMYLIDLKDEQSIMSVRFDTSGYHQGTISYAYYSTLVNEFNTITNVALSDAPCIQISGTEEGYDVFKELENPKTIISNFNYIHVSAAKEVYNIFANPKDQTFNRFRYNEDWSQPFSANGVELLPNTLYLIKNDWNKDKEFLSANEYYVERINDNEYKYFHIDKYDPSVEINGNKINLLESSYIFKDFQDITSLIVYSGARLDVSLQYILKDLSIEDNELKDKKVEWENARVELLESIHYSEPWGSPSEEEKQQHFNNWVDNIYPLSNERMEKFKQIDKEYMVAIKEELKKQEEANGKQ